MWSKSRARLGLRNIWTQRLGPFRPGHLHQNDVGFEEGELAAAKFAGFQPIALGPRVLRTETAAAYILSVVDQIAR